MMAATTMNHYGALAQKHWKKLRPAEYSQITDPETYFTDLGAEISAEIDRRRNEQERQTQAGANDSFLDNLGALNRIQTSIEDDVLREMAFIEPSTPS